MFVAELRAFADELELLEQRGGAVARETTTLCLNLPDPVNVLRQRFKSTLESILTSFDSAFEHIVQSKQSKMKSEARSACHVDDDGDILAQGRHTKHAKKVLSAWLWEHFYPTETRLKPIPTRAEKEDLARQTGLTTTQVGDWFVNARARLWKPYIEGLIRGVYNDAMVKKALDLQADAAA
jgi:hypothetical protein